MRKKILIMAYAISPVRGSEYALGWNFVTKMAEHNDLVVLYGTSGDYFGESSDLENYVRSHAVPNVRFVLVEPSWSVNFVNYFNKKGMGPAFYVAFKIWHKAALNVAKELCRIEEFDLVHQLGPIGFREPGYLWALPVPFVWGPVGGAQFVNKNLLANIPWTTAILFRLKNIANYLQLRFSSRVRHAARAADKIVFATEANRLNFERFFGKTGPVISELACSNDPPETVEPKQASRSEACKTVELVQSHHGSEPMGERYPVLKMVWCGRISPVKNLYFLLYALTLVRNRQSWSLTMIGDGKMRSKLMQLAVELGIDANISWAGRHTRAEAIKIMRGHDLHVMCSLSEANTSVFYEATDLVIPTLALDQDGMTRELSHGNGILVPITDYQTTVEAYASRIDELVVSRGRLEALKARTAEMRTEFSWERKIKTFDSIYESVLAESGV